MHGNGNTVNRVGDLASLCGEFGHYRIVDSKTVTLAKKIYLFIFMQCVGFMAAEFESG